MQIEAVRSALPDHYYAQQHLADVLAQRWGEKHQNVERLVAVHRNTSIVGRHLALPLEAYDELETFEASNDAYIAAAVALGEKAVQEALAAAGCRAEDIDHFFFVSITGLATPSIDALLCNRMPFRRDIKRTPIFGLGCMAGAAGIARASDAVRAFPKERALLLSVELCSLTLQRGDASVANLVASGLFGDGAAALVMSGSDAVAKSVDIRSRRPKVIATRSIFYRDTEAMMGWHFSDHGFRIVLSGKVPEVIEKSIGPDVRAFLKEHKLSTGAISRWLCHPGGPKVLDALQAALTLDDTALDYSRRSLSKVGNVSSASVLMILQDVLNDIATQPPSGSYGLLMAMGPGFSAELVLLRW